MEKSFENEMFYVPLALQNYLKTWDNLIKKGWYGPNICTLCKKYVEYVDHLLINCSFTVNVWKKVSLPQNFSDLGWKQF